MGKDTPDLTDLSSVVVRLDGDPEAVADALIADQLPETFLDDIDLSTDHGKAALLASFMIRQHKATVEKDEIVRFVERNRAELKSTGLKLLEAIAAAAKKTEGGENIAFFVDYITTQVNHALAGQPEKIDVRSDRLLWLVYALASQLSSNYISYENALAVLRKPEHQGRISSFALMYMLQDYAETVGSPQQPSSEYVMLIGECGLLAEIDGAVKAAVRIVTGSNLPRDQKAFVDYVTRARDYLEQRGLLEGEVAADCERVLSRLGADVDPDDF